MNGVGVYLLLDYFIYTWHTAKNWLQSRKWNIFCDIYFILACMCKHLFICSTQKIRTKVLSNNFLSFNVENNKNWKCALNSATTNDTRIRNFQSPFVLRCCSDVAEFHFIFIVYAFNSITCKFFMCCGRFEWRKIRNITSPGVSVWSVLCFLFHIHT